VCSTQYILYAKYVLHKKYRHILWFFFSGEFWLIYNHHDCLAVPWPLCSRVHKAHWSKPLVYLIDFCNCVSRSKKCPRYLHENNCASDPVLICFPKDLYFFKTLSYCVSTNWLGRNLFLSNA
jgi:hypothetical protein